MATPTQLLTNDQLADELGVHHSTTAQWRLIAGQGPRFIKVGASVRDRRSDIEEWLTSQTRAGTKTDA